MLQVIFEDVSKRFVCKQLHNVSVGKISGRFQAKITLVWLFYMLNGNSISRVRCIRLIFIWTRTSFFQPKRFLVFLTQKRLGLSKTIICYCPVYTMIVDKLLEVLVF